MKKLIMVVPVRNILYPFFLLAAIFLLLPILLVSISGKSNLTSSSGKKLDIGKDSAYTLNGDSIRLKNKGEIPKIKVYLTEEKRIEEMNIEDYVRGVVSGEMPASFEIEALKAQAVAARTYAVSKMVALGGKPCELHKAQGADICDTVHCQVYKSKEKRFQSWAAKDAEANWSKITEAVVATGAQVLTYNGEIVTQPLYFSASGGRTEDGVQVFSSNVPYLKSVISEGEESNPKYISKVSISLNDLAKKINNAYPNAKVASSKLKNQISIVSRNSGNTVNEIKLGNEKIKGTKFRELLDLKSANFQIKFSGSNAEITCYGYGHGVGMSQWGANYMAKGGKNYMEILTHYYTGVGINKFDELIK
jgi:stage II sporulation protein D